MGFIEDLRASYGSLLEMLQHTYKSIGDRDKNLQGIQWQNEQRCEQEIQDIRKEVMHGKIKPGTSLVRFSDEALDEQKSCLKIADEKVALATKALDMVNAHLQVLDQYDGEDEELQRDDEHAAVSARGIRPGRARESTRGVQKKTQLAAEPAPSANVDSPVDTKERTYCFCNQVHYGHWIACDGPDCKIEWFHLGCVGLQEVPEGMWYCTACDVTRRWCKNRSKRDGGGMGCGGQ